jgi:hypothetical protein
VLRPGVVDECAERLLLKRSDARIELISPELIGPAEPGVIDRVWSGQRYVVHARHASPYVGDCLGGRGVCGWIDEPEVRRQREGDPDEAVFSQIAEVAGLVTVAPEVIGVDRPEERVVGVRVESAHELEQPKPRLNDGWRKLKAVDGHMAVGARASIRLEARESSVEERAAAPVHRVARFAVALTTIVWRRIFPTIPRRPPDCS